VGVPAIKVCATYVRISSIDAIIGGGNRGKVLYVGLRYALVDQLDGPLRSQTPLAIRRPLRRRISKPTAFPEDRRYCS